MGSSNSHRADFDEALPPPVVQLVHNVMTALRQELLWSAGGTISGRWSPRFQRWELRFAPFHVEIRERGPHDGGKARLSTEYPLSSIAGAFDEMPRIVWVVPAAKRSGKQRVEVVFDGYVGGCAVTLRLFSAARSRLPGLVLDKEANQLRLSAALQSFVEE